MLETSPSVEKPPSLENPASHEISPSFEEPQSLEEPQLPNEPTGTNDRKRRFSETGLEAEVEILGDPIGDGVLGEDVEA